jgi:hypothetical protein
VPGGVFEGDRTPITMEEVLAHRASREASFVEVDAGLGPDVPPVTIARFDQVDEQLVAGVGESPRSGGFHVTCGIEDSIDDL